MSINSTPRRDDSALYGSGADRRTARVGRQFWVPALGLPVVIGMTHAGPACADSDPGFTNELHMSQPLGTG